MVELVGAKMPVAVVDSRVGAVLRLVDVAHVDAQARVRKPRAAQPCGVGEEDGDEQGAEGEEHAEAEVAEAAVDVPGPDDAVVVAVEEGDVLLEDGWGWGVLGGLLVVYIFTVC